MFRVTESGSQGFVNFAVYDPSNGDAGQVLGLATGDVAWQGAGVSYAPGDTPEIQVNNYDSQPVSFSVEFFDEPSSPASYSGSSFLASSGPGCCSPSDESELFYAVPGTAPYVADVSLSGGAIILSSNGMASQTFDSSGEYSLGQLTAGDRVLQVDPAEGPSAQWTITIRALPISVYGVSFNHTDVQPGVINTLSYNTNGSTSISAEITNATGQLVRSLASGFPVQVGSHTLTWDERDANGNPVPDGLYTATVSSTDPFGNLSTGQAQIAVDSTPPTITLASTTLKLKQALVVKFADNLSGVASGSLTTNSDGGKVSLRAGQSTVSYIPSGGWKPGHYNMVASAADKAGNKATRTLSFTVRSPLPARHPSRLPWILVSKFAGRRAAKLYAPRKFEPSSHYRVKSAVWSEWGRSRAVAEALLGTQFQGPVRWRRTTITYSKPKNVCGVHTYTQFRSESGASAKLVNEGHGTCLFVVQ